MSSFFGSPSSQPAPQDMAAQVQTLKQRVALEAQMAQAQALMNSSTEKCYMKCVINPGSSLSSKEQTCLATCFDKYLEAFNIVSKSYTSSLRAARDHQAQHAADQHTLLS